MEFDRYSNDSSDNEQDQEDELMQDARDPDPADDENQDGDNDNEDDDDNDNDDDDDDDNAGDNENDDDEGGEGTQDGGTDSQARAGSASGDGPSIKRTSATPSPGSGTPKWQPVLRPQVLNAKTYDIIPTMAAPMATSINAIAVTPDLRYWMTGGTDGYIRKYDGPGTINGKTLLTVAQRHPFVDSVTKAGILMSYWENAEPQAPGARADDLVLSPVYSLAVHSQALWCLSGLESGGINLQSVRHDEGKRIACLQKHTNAVSVLSLGADEKSVLSGSWDKNIYDWDLNTGAVTRSFDGNNGQISAIEVRPMGGALIPAEAGLEELPSETFFSNNAAPTTANGSFPLGDGQDFKLDTNGLDGSFDLSAAALDGAAVEATAGDAPGSPGQDSLFGGSPTAGSDLFGDNDGMGAFGGDDDNEFSRAMMQDSAENPGNVNTTNDDAGEGIGDFDMSVPAFDTDPTAAPAVQPLDTSTQLDSTLAEGLGDSTMTTTNPDGDEHGLATDIMSMDPLPDFPEASGPTDDITGSGTQNGLDMAASGDTFKIEDSQPMGLNPESPSMIFASAPGDSPASAPAHHTSPQTSDSTFFSACFDGTIRIWDRRMQNPVARIGNRPGVPPWCMGATWSPDGNWIYVGRRNGTVEEFNINQARRGWEPSRVFKFPAGSGAVSCVRAMPNGRHLICASHDILRLYDLHSENTSKNAPPPFLIVPGPPRAGVISTLWLDPGGRFMLSTAGNRGWEGSHTECLIGYEINVPE
ncbi:WD40-repeat-containing domain protein [Microdochium trichocladiopsis]|uniref:WD40-repeat-containing domain protein n=1 Tax=Microdochium trichocladiopsis TaxID=1682393 RepID=A0A9P8Y2X3_9PEZI|nr:WD40-repeat-containing domain protein [Microdochium trichocladiopsis]KAH7029474.1 WD40-repeat-containing domain protein [Microdochium trichocladiopsis]